MCSGFQDNSRSFVRIQFFFSLCSRNITDNEGYLVAMYGNGILLCCEVYMLICVCVQSISSASVDSTYHKPNGVVCSYNQ